MTLVVPDYDDAIEHYVQDLGFVLVSDERVSDVNRWVEIKPSPDAQTGIILAEAATDAQVERVGLQTGGLVTLFLMTDDFDRDRTRFIAAGIVFEEEPRDEPYGRVAIFRDKYGNRWDLIQPPG